MFDDDKKDSRAIWLLVLAAGFIAILACGNFAIGATGDPLLEGVPPTIADFTNAGHNHTNTASGGTIPATAIGSGEILHERGGLEANVSAYDGFVRISSGATSQEAIVQNTVFTNPAAATTTAAATQYDLTSGAGSLAGEVNPAHGRNIHFEITDGDTSISAISISVTGINMLGAVDSESYTTVTSGSGNKAFATVTNIAVVSVTGAGAGDTLDIGFGDVFGLCYDVKNSSDVFKSVTDTADSTGSDTVDATYNTVTFGTAPDGTHDYEVWFKLR